MCSGLEHSSSQLQNVRLGTRVSICAVGLPTLDMWVLSSFLPLQTVLNGPDRGPDHRSSHLAHRSPGLPSPVGLGLEGAHTCDSDRHCERLLPSTASAMEQHLLHVPPPRG